MRDSTKETCEECRSMEQAFEEYKAFCKSHPKTELNKKLNKIFWVTLIVGCNLILAMKICEYFGAYRWVLGISLFTVVAGAIEIIYLTCLRTAALKRERDLNEEWEGNFKENVHLNGDMDLYIQWCDSVLGCDRPLNDFFTQIEKIASVLVIPVMISYVCGLDYKSPDLVFILQILLAIMVGIFLYIALPQVFPQINKNYRYLKQFKLDLTILKYRELQKEEKKPVANAGISAQPSNGNLEKGKVVRRQCRLSYKSTKSQEGELSGRKRISANYKSSKMNKKKSHKKTT